MNSVMAVKKISLENYKCFSKQIDVVFNTPDNSSEGKGLNILVGENNSGKTAVLSALTKLKGNAVLDKEEKFNGKDVSIIFTDNEEKTTTVSNMPGGAQIKINGDDLNFSFSDIQFIKDTRVWTSNFNGGINETIYRSALSFRRQDIDNNLARALAGLEKDEEKKETLKEFNEAIKIIIPSFSSWTIDSTGKTGTYICYEMLNGSSQDIDFSLGSGILNLFRILYGLIVDSSAKIVVIDEPEAYLHPRAQEALSEILVKKSKDKQIILATHSPYIFRKPIQSNANILLFKRKDKLIEIINLNKEFGLLGTMSPTYAEISFHAYGIYSPEFHNELYGFVHSKLVGSDAKITAVDKYLVSEGDEKLTWKYKGIDAYKGLSSYIRNYIHHPEQDDNRRYTDQELIKSIDFLIKCLSTQVSS